MSTAVTALVDTGAWYALAASDDRHHEAATSFYLSQQGRLRWVTTDLIAAETWSLLNGRMGRAGAIRFWESLRRLQVPIVALDPVDLEAAWQIACAWSDQDFSLTDCTSFALMERLGITQAFAFDHHFLIYRYGAERRHALHRLPR